MKILAERDALTPALDALHRVIDRKAVIPILTHVRLEAGDGRLRLSAHSLDACAEVAIPAEIERPGSLAVEAETLRTIVRGLPTGAQVRLSDDDKGRVTLQASRSRYVLPSLPDMDFPPLFSPAPGTKTTCLKFAAGEAGRLLSRPASFVAREGADRLMLQGVYLHAHAARIWAAGCDGVVGCINPSADGLSGQNSGYALLSADSDSHVILPTEAVERIVSTLAAGGDLITDGQVAVAQGINGDLYGTKLIDQRYPPIWRIVPERCAEQSILCDREEVIACLSRLAALVEMKAARVSISWGEGDEEARVSIENGSASGMGEEVASLHEPARGSMDLIISGEKILKCLSAIPGDRVEISWAGTGHNARIYDPEMEALTVLAMPLKRITQEATA